MANTVKIPGELESVATGNKVADVANIKDKTKGDKSQAEINDETNASLADRYTKAETYNKTQLDNMITTPETAYKDYDTYADMVAETVHPSGAIYRVANYDGTQAVTNKYAEYSWDGTQYKLMAVRDHGIDNEPTAGSNNLVKSGGVSDLLAHNIVRIDLPQTETGSINESGVVNPSSTDYGIVRPILLNPGETILINDGLSTYIGNNVPLLFVTDSSGNWNSNIITRASVGGERYITNAKYTNNSQTAMYVGICAYTAECKYSIDKNVEAASKEDLQNKMNKLVSFCLIQSDVKQGTINGNDGITITINNRVYTNNYIAVIPGANYSVKLPTGYTCVCLYYDTDLNFISGTGEWSNLKEIKIPANAEFIRVQFNKTGGIFVSDFEKVYFTLSSPNDLFIDVKSSSIGLLPNIDTVSKKLVFGSDARLRYNGSWISLSNLELSYVHEYGNIACIVFNTDTLTLRSDYQILTNDILVGYINHSSGVSKTLYDVQLPFAYTIDGKTEKEDISKSVIAEIAQTNDRGYRDVYILAKNIKDNRPYFLNETYANEDSFVDTSYLDEKIRNIPNGKHFIFASDNHIDYYNVDMAQRETEIMAYVKARLNSGCVVTGGDIIGSQPTKFKGAKVLSMYMEDKFNAFGSEFIFCEGNHDANATINGDPIPSYENN